MTVADAKITKRTLKNGNTRYSARVRWFLAGKRQSQQKTFSTKREAQSWARYFADKIESGQNVKGMTLLDAYERKYNTRIKATGRPNYIANFGSLRNIITGYFPHVLLSSITPDDYQNFLNKLTKKYTHKTIKTINSEVKGIFKYAVSNSWIDRNPTIDARLPKQEDISTTSDLLTSNEVIRVVDYIMNNKWIARKKDGKTPIGTPYTIVFALYTGMRQGEILGLKYNDVDFKNGILHIRQQYNKLKADSKERGLVPLKTRTSYRDIAVPEKILDMIQMLHIPGDELCFYSHEDTVPNESSLGYHLHRILKKLDIDKPNYHFHYLRHQHASMLLAKGIDIQAVSQRLGHADIETTSAFYIDTLEDKKQSDNEKIVKLLNSGL